MASNYDRQIFRQLEDVLKKCDNLSQEIKDLKVQHKNEIFELEAKHQKEITELNNKIDTLQQENEKLKNENMILKNDNIRMKAIINKDSTNSSIPPSKDEKPKTKKQNLREKTEKKTGGQKGHKGVTLTKQKVQELLNKPNVEKEIIIHGNRASKHCVIKYEIDTKTVVVVKEHRFYCNKLKELKLPKEFKPDVHYGAEFKALCNVMTVEEVISLERIEQFIEIITKGILKISQGSIVNWLKETSQKCRPVLKHIKISLKNSEKVSTDLTETKENEKKRYVRNYSTEKITLYIPSKSKKINWIKRQWILRGYTGYIIHDHDTGLYNYGLKEKHVECNVHLRRYLKNNTELTGHAWSKEMDKLLLEIKAEKEKLLNLNINKFSTEKLEEYSNRYDKILEDGLKEHKADKKIKASKYLRDEEKPLLSRLEKYKLNHLIFAYDFSVPFDNNLSERDLRPIKTKKKIAGCHRSYSGLKDYCNVKSIISTCKKQGINFFEELVNILKGNPTTIIV